MVKDWEARQVRGAMAAGGTDGYGWRAVYQAWKTFAWLGVFGDGALFGGGKVASEI